MDEAIYPIAKNPNKSLLTAAGVGWCDLQYHCIRKDGYPQPQINYCTEGKGVLVTEGKTTEITKGMSFFLPADVPHEYYALGDVWSLEWVTFSGCGCAALLEQFGLKNAVTAFHEDPSEMERTWQSIYTVLKRNNENASLRADSYMYRFLTEYQISRMKPAGTPSEFSAYKLAEEYISAHLSEEIAMEDIAAAAGVSPQYLCRIFKRKTDMRPFQYINCRRLSYAKQLLTKGNMTVSQVSEAVGYHDTSYFCKLFRAQEGVSPKKFMSS